MDMETIELNPRHLGSFLGPRTGEDNDRICGLGHAFRAVGMTVRAGQIDPGPEGSRRFLELCGVPNAINFAWVLSRLAHQATMTDRSTGSFTRLNELFEPLGILFEEET